MMPLALACAFSGMAALCLAMERAPPALGRVGMSGRAWRVAGGVLVATAFGLCCEAAGASMGLVWWVVGLAVAGLVLVFGLKPYRPGLILPLALAAPGVALVLATL